MTPEQNKTLSAIRFARFFLANQAQLVYAY